MFAKKNGVPVADAPTGDARSSDDPDGLVVIGKSTHVSGKIGACRVLDVYGVLEADVVTEMLIVREGGGIKGTIMTHDAKILGVVDGILNVAEHLDIEATGQVVGTVTYKTLSIAKGARFLGKLDLHGATAEPVEQSVLEFVEAAPAPLANGVVPNGFYPSTH